MNLPLPAVAEPVCRTCGSVLSLRVIRPRVPCTVSTFGGPEIRCLTCCKATRGMFRLTKIALTMVAP